MEITITLSKKQIVERLLEVKRDPKYVPFYEFIADAFDGDQEDEQSVYQAFVYGATCLHYPDKLRIPTELFEDIEDEDEKVEFGSTIMRLAMRDVSITATVQEAYALIPQFIAALCDNNQAFLAAVRQYKKSLHE